MIIATQSVGKTITRSRTQAFNETMGLAAKNAKRILQTDGTLNTELLKNSLGYSTNEYDFDVITVDDGYLVRLISNETGKFKNVDFTKITQNTDWIYTKDAGNESGKNIISFKIDSTGDLKKIDNDSDDEKIAKNELKNKCTVVADEDKYDPSKSSEENIGKMISFCNNDVIYKYNGELVKGKSEDFYVIKDNGDSVTALARYNLMVGKVAGTFSYDIRFHGLQANNKNLSYELAFAIKDENNKNSGGYIYAGYWTNLENTLLNKPLSKYGESYPANVFDENSLLWTSVQTYKSYFISTLKKTPIDMRLITYDELIDLGCDALRYTCETDKVVSNKREWVYNTQYWTATAENYWGLWRVMNVGGNFSGYYFSDDAAGVRPVIKIEKSEI